MGKRQIRNKREEKRNELSQEAEEIRRKGQYDFVCVCLPHTEEERELPQEISCRAGPKAFQ